MGTNECFVIHHTDCGVLFFTDEVMRNLLVSSLETAELTPDGFRDVGRGPGSTEGEFIDWLTRVALEIALVIKPGAFEIPKE